MADYKSIYTGQEIDTGIGKAMTALQEEQYTGTYSKPSGGIPENDLSEAVKQKLNAGGGGSVSGLTEQQKTALNDMFKAIAYAEDDILTNEYRAFKTAFGIDDRIVMAISAVYAGGNVYEGTTLEQLTGLTVSATYDDGTTGIVTGYTLSGSLNLGNNTITVSYREQTTTFTVTVVEAPTLESISAVYSGGDVVEGATLNDLTGIVVTAHYSDETTQTVTGYTLSGSLNVGSNTITVTYEQLTTTFTVNVIAPADLVSISATYTGGSVYEGTTLQELTGITVTGTYSDSSTATISNYTLSGTLALGTSTVTVTVADKTTTFDVTVIARPTLVSIEATYTGGSVPAGTQLNQLTGITVVGTYSDSSTETITDYELSGSLATVGTSTITVSVGQITDTFDVTVTAEEEYVTDGLIFRLDGIENTRNGHTSGTLSTIQDISGNNYDLTPWVSGQHGRTVEATENSFVFDGDTVFKSDNATFKSWWNKSGATTMEVVFKIASDSTASGLHCILAGDELTTANLPYQKVLWYDLTNGLLAVTGKNNAIQDSNLIGTKNHISVDYEYTDATNLSVTARKNGVQQVSLVNTTGYIRNGNPIAFGGHYTNDVKEWFKGDLYAVRFYNRKLTAEEVARNYRVDKRRFGL